MKSIILKPLVILTVVLTVSSFTSPSGDNNKSCSSTGNGDLELLLLDKSKKFTVRVSDDFEGKINVFKFLGRDFILAPMGYIKTRSISLPAGNHKIKIYTPGIESNSQDVRIEENKLTPVLIEIYELHVNGYHNDRSGTSGDYMLRCTVGPIN
jgi:hypothetical protein